jgi:polysaccharide pyruvyl transferase CsaB
MRAVLCGYYGMGNGGDEALLAALLQMLPPAVTPLVLSGNPAETAQRYGVEAVPRMSLRAVWSALRGSESLIWGGGSLMQDTTSLASPLYYAGVMKLAQWLGLRTVAWAQGIGPLRRASSRGVTRWVLKDCDAVSVRDAGSARWLADWGIQGCLAPDPVWALKSTPPGQALPPAPRVAVALRPHPCLTSACLDLIAEALVNFQQATQASMVLVPFQPSRDLAIATRLAERLPGPHQIIQLTDPHQLKGLFQSVSMTLGMRFHALVMAAAEGSRCFALSYDPKVSQLMSDLSLPGWGLPQPHLPGSQRLPLLPTTAAEITDQWLKCYHGPALPTETVAARIDQALMHRTLLREALGHPLKP